MIQLIVTSFNDAPVADLAASFDELGGTIGRAPDNQLVLPDPERVVSRVHAKVLFRGGTYALVACGGNALLHNERPVGHGREVPLAAGDTIQMGGYVLAVGGPEKAAPADPFAALFGGASGSASNAARPAGAGTSSTPAVAPSRAQARAVPAGAGGSPIPEDWDPFERSHAVPRIAGASASSRVIAEPASRRDDSIDDLFGLAAGSGGDPLRNGPLAASGLQPNTTADADPLRSLGRKPTPVAAPQPDHASDLDAPWTDAGDLRPAARPAPVDDAVYSWRSVPGGSRAERATAQDHAVLDASEAAGASTASDTRSAATHDELLRALLEGLAVADLPIQRLTPGLMRQIGQILHESTEGAVQLLAIRTALKREMRAGVTVINASRNNSLKFSPSVDVALRHLLGPPAKGFMPAPDSVRDAYEDLRAHELAVMAGMKAALAGVLERFDPAVLEGKLTARSGLGGLIPSARKAKLWNLFESLYKQLAAEAADDFDSLFGKAFLKAYERYLQQLSDAKPPPLEPRP